MDNDLSFPLISMGEGHIDTAEGMAEVLVGMSMDVFRDEHGVPYVMLHMDVADDDGFIMSVGVLIDGSQVLAMTDALTAARRLASGATRDRLN